jgi:hypothetical protein
MCQQEADNYFSPLLQTWQDNGFLANPSKTHNMHECDMQVNNEPGKVVATKGSRDVHHVTSGERGEAISLPAVIPRENSCRLTAFLMETGRRMNSKVECRLGESTSTPVGRGESS